MSAITGVAKFAGEDGERMTAGADQDQRSCGEGAGRIPHRDSPKRSRRIWPPACAKSARLRATLARLDPIARKATVDGMLARKETEFNDALAKSHGVIVDALEQYGDRHAGRNGRCDGQHLFGTPAIERKRNERSVPNVKLIAPAGWRVEPLPAEAEQPAGRMAFFARSRNARMSGSRFRAAVPDNAPPTQPYWLAKPRTKDQFDWDESMPRNLPFAPASRSMRESN